MSDSSGQSIMLLKQLKKAYVLHYMLFGDSFNGTYAKTQMEKEMTELDYIDFDKLKEIGMRPPNTSSTTKIGETEHE